MNELDRIKKTKYSPITKKEIQKQKTYFENFMKEVMKRKKKGDEKYGNYILDIDRQLAFKELEEEIQDVVAHLIFLGYRYKYKEDIR